MYGEDREWVFGSSFLGEAGMKVVGRENKWGR